MIDRPWLSSYPDGVPSEIGALRHDSLGELLEESFRKYESRTALSFRGASVSYAELDRSSALLAGHLQAIGLAQGDRVAVMLPNVPQYTVAVAAIMRAGMVLVNVNPLYTERELSHQLIDSGTRAIVVLDGFAAALTQCIPVTQLSHVIRCSMSDTVLPPPGETPDATATEANGVAWWTFPAALASGARNGWRPVRVCPDDVAVLQYTGGTTGVSKGATLLHRNLIANVLQNEAWLSPLLRRIEPDQVFTAACMLPLYHVFAFVVNMLVLMRAGGTNVLVLNARDAGSALADLRPHAVDFLPGLNTLFASLLRHPDFDLVDWRRLRATVSGGMPTQADIARQWRARTGCAISEGYGLTETSASVTSNPILGHVHESTIGVPLPSTDIAVLDDDRQPVRAGEVGQIAVRGPQVMRGYWGQPDQDDECFTADGFFLTGDLGTMDGEGIFRIVDRKKDMILVSGFNVYPSEIEAVISEVPGVVDCAAFGVADPTTGEAVKLVVVASAAGVTEAALRAHCTQTLTRYKHPKWIEFREFLPRSAVGKILRRELRAMAAATPPA